MMGMYHENQKAAASSGTGGTPVPPHSESSPRATAAVDNASDFVRIPSAAARRFLFMPIYEYICKSCKNAFTLTLTMTEHDRKRVACPKCKNKKVEQQFGSFAAVTSKKS
jgi:putative FmdB family regulatory protein